MKFTTTISILAASMLALTSMASFAGQGQGRGGAGADRARQVDRDRTYDRDRMGDRARSVDSERKRTRDQDRTKMQDPSNMQNEDIYGNALMSATERKQYRNELGGMQSTEQRNEFQYKHEQKMQNRALQQGQDLVPPGQGPIYGGELMSVQERNQYREQLRLLESDHEREQHQAQHRDRINQRANALGLDVEEAE